MKNTILILLLALTVMSGANAGEPTLRWSPSDAIILHRTEATFSVILDDTLDVRSLEIFVRFDPDVVTSLVGEPGALFDGFELFEGFEFDALDIWHAYCVILGHDQWTVGPGELFRWRVEGTNQGTSPVTTLDVTLLPPGGGDYTEVELVDDQITVVVAAATADLPTAIPQVTLYPNPFNPRTRVELFLPGGGPGRLEVVDARGRLVDTPWSGSTGASPLVVDWDGCDRTGAALPSGVYTFRLVGARGEGASARGVLLR